MISLKSTIFITQVIKPDPENGQSSCDLQNKNRRSDEYDDREDESDLKCSQQEDNQSMMNVIKTELNRQQLQFCQANLADDLGHSSSLTNVPGFIPSQQTAYHQLDHASNNPAHVPLSSNAAKMWMQLPGTEQFDRHSQSLQNQHLRHGLPAFEPRLQPLSSIGYFPVNTMAPSHHQYPYANYLNPSMSDTGSPLNSYLLNHGQQHHGDKQWNVDRDFTM